MPGRSPAAPSFPPAAAQRASFTPDDWALLVRLPGRVLIAATSAERDTPKHTVAEGLAGIEAIAAGRASPSRFVRDLVAAIYAEPDHRPSAAPADELPSAEEFVDPAAGIAEVLAECRTAAGLLSRRLPPEDADAYRGWLTSIATTVCSAARTGGVLGFGGATVTEAERRFLVELAGALTT
jgi:hypothetical protein